MPLELGRLVEAAGLKKQGNKEASEDVISRSCVTIYDSSITTIHDSRFTIHESGALGSTLVEAAGLETTEAIAGFN